MSLSVRSKSFEVSQAEPVSDRPKIWVEGQQQPKFVIKAYGAATLGMARRDLSPAILKAERRLRALGRRFATGEPRLDLAQIGPLGRILPSQHRLGRWTDGLAGLFGTSHAILVPGDVAEPVVALRDLVRTRATSSQLRLKGTTAAPQEEVGQSQGPEPSAGEVALPHTELVPPNPHRSHIASLVS